MVDSIDGSHPHPHGQYPLSASSVGKIGAVSAQPGIDLATTASEATTLPMRPLRALYEGCSAHNKGDYLRLMPCTK